LKTASSEDGSEKLKVKIAFSFRQWIKYLKIWSRLIITYAPRQQVELTEHPTSGLKLKLLGVIAKGFGIWLKHDK
jgi:hypothetical protein